MSKKYLASDNLPPRLPLIQAFWTAAALKVFEAPQWLWGVFAALYFIGVIYEIVRMVAYEKVEL